MRTYKITRGYRIFLGYISLIFLGTAWGGIEQRSIAAVIPLIIGALILIFAFTYRVIISPDNIKVQLFFCSGQIYFFDSTGITSNDFRLKVHSRLPDIKPLQVWFFIQKHKEIKQLLLQHLPNLDATQAKISDAEIIENMTTGTPEQRRELLKKGKKLANYFNTAAIMLATWVLIFPEFADTLCKFCVVLPLLAMFPYRKKLNIMRLGIASKGYPSLFGPILVLPVVLCYSAFNTFNIIDINKLISVSIFWGAVYFALLGYNKPALKEGTRTLIVMLIVSACYGFGVVAFTNCDDDKTEVKIYTSRVTGKYSFLGLLGSHHLKVAPWLPGHNITDITVPLWQYAKTDTGALLNIYVKQGGQGARWYYTYK